MNHRIVEVTRGRDLWASSRLTPLLKRDHLEQVAQMGSECLQCGRLHSLPRQPEPKLSCSQGLLMFKSSLLCFSLCSLPLILNQTCLNWLQHNYIFLQNPAGLATSQDTM